LLQIDPEGSARARVAAATATVAAEEEAEKEGAYEEDEKEEDGNAKVSDRRQVDYCDPRPVWRLCTTAA